MRRSWRAAMSLGVGAGSALDVTSGQNVAFASALLRCGTPADFEREPERRLRLTIGLRKVDGRWIVTHEHHSFTDPT
jgi:ketosteroid isomerase-like protein